MDNLVDVEIKKGIQAEFFTEAVEVSSSMTDAAYKLSDDPENNDAIKEILTGIDSLLAGSSMLGIDDVYRLGRSLESLLHKIQDGEIQPDFEVLDIMVLSIETLNKIAVKYSNDEEMDIDVEEIIGSISFFTDPEEISQEPTLEMDVPEIKEDLEVSKADLEIFALGVTQHLQTVEDCIKTLKETEDKFYLNGLIRAVQGIKGASLFINHTEMELRAEVLLEEMARTDIFGKDIDRKESLFEEISEFVSGIHQFLKQHNMKEEELEMPTSEVISQATQVNGDKKVESNPGSKGSSPHFGDSLKVNINKIDRLMNSVGELISLNTKLINIRQLVEADIDLNSCSKNIGKITAFLDKLTEQLYNQMLSIRMMPVRSLFNKFKNVIETLSVEQQKKIEVTIKGERTEIDRVVLESLRDPLIHLIRNAVDHGVETPEARKAKGKDEVGHVNLRAFNDVNSVIIEIEDDGKGIDPQKILKKAIEKGLASEDEADSLPRREILNFIFSPGFSTAEKVTSISGRGVGMDVVRTTVERHGGNIIIQTEKGRGSCFKIRLPLAMSMVDTLIVRSGGETFAIPSEGIERILKTPKRAFKTIFEKSVIPMNGSTIPFRRLSEIFEDYCEDDPKKSYVLTAIIKSENRRLALGLDEILGKQKVVIKNIGKFLGNVKGISGAYIQGDGRIILVVNIRDVCRIKTQEM